MQNERRDETGISPFSKGEIKRGSASRFRQRTFLNRKVVWGVEFLILLIGVLAVFQWRAPSQFPRGELFSVAEGASLSGIARRLEERGIIRSPFWFKVFGVFLGGARGLKAGDYFLDAPEVVVRLAWRFTHSEYALTPVFVTVPEGLNNREVAERLSSALVRFDSPQFLEEAKEKEGYLFPDTYRFLANEKPSAVIMAMRALFDRKIAELEPEIASFGRPLRDVLIMASLLEEEARTKETRRTVAGILWKRLDKGMLLQVDAVFPYIFKGTPFNLTNGDLLVDSPYNTYKYVGLPPTPISNPGLDAIRAAITPIATPYWYYLSDKEGEMHYAVTHAEHLQNREKYLER